MAVTQEELFDALEPLVSSNDLVLHDVEITKGLVRVTVWRAAGVSVEDLAEANRIISAYLDDHDPMDVRYTLEVSSPGVERRLRRPAHFQAAVGETVKIKTIEATAAVPDRRLEGELLEATSDGIVVANGDAAVTLHYDEIDRARTVYEWGATAKPSPSRSGGSKGARRQRPTAAERVTAP
jgi:ribosome maturation factor RimP